MQVKKHRESDRSGGDMLEGDSLRKKSSCFSNIKIFLISECALMLAQGTVGAYLVSATQPELVPRSHCLRWYCELTPCYCRSQSNLCYPGLRFACGVPAALHAKWHAAEQWHHTEPPLPLKARPVGHVSCCTTDPCWTVVGKYPAACVSVCLYLSFKYDNSDSTKEWP